MNNNSLMNSLRKATQVNRQHTTVGLESYEQVERDLNKTINHLANLQNHYKNVSSFYNNVVALENADYSEVIHSTANAIINSAIIGAGLKSHSGLGLESMSFNIGGMVNNAKRVANEIWKSICEWFNKLLTKLDSFMIEYRDGFKHMGDQLIAIGNGVIKGELVKNPDAINTDSISYPIGVVNNSNLADRFLRLRENYDLIVSEPLNDAFTSIKNLVDNFDYHAGSKSYRRDLERAVEKMLSRFNQSASAGIDRVEVLPGSKFTDDYFAGAHLRATKITNVQKVTLTGIEDGYDGDIDLVIEKSAASQQIIPFTGRQLLQIGSDLRDSNNPWIRNKKGGDYTDYGRILLKDLTKISKELPDEVTLEIVRKIIMTYSSCILKYNTAMYKLYKYAAMTVYYVGKKSAVAKP